MSHVPAVVYAWRSDAAGTAEDEQELKDKIKALAFKRFGASDVGAMQSLFLSYDGDNDGLLSSSELSKLLSDANVGNFLTRSSWVSAIFKKLDTNADKRLSWAEYLAVYPKPAAPAPAPAAPAPASPTSPASPVSYPLKWRTNANGTIAIRTTTGEWSIVHASPDLATQLSAVLTRWLPTLRRESDRTGVPLSWLAAIATAESGGDPRAVSPAGAVGLFQLMPMWWRGHTAEEMKDGSRSASYAADLLAKIRADQQELPIVASVYNAGSSDAHYAPHLAVGSATFPWGMVENKGYISKVVGLNDEAIARGLASSVSVRKSGFSAGALGPLILVGGIIAAVSGK